MDFKAALNKSIAQTYANGIRFLESAIQDKAITKKMTVEKALEISRKKKEEALALAGTGE